MDQLMWVCDSELHIFLRDRQVPSLRELGSVADLYMVNRQAQRGKRNNSKPVNNSVKQEPEKTGEGSVYNQEAHLLQLWPDWPHCCSLQGGEKGQR